MRLIGSAKKIVVLHNYDYCVTEIVGGKDAVDQARQQFCDDSHTKNKGNVVRSMTKISKRDEISDDSSMNYCPTCWQVFGKIMNRKHLCQSLNMYFCNDCSR